MFKFNVCFLGSLDTENLKTVSNLLSNKVRLLRNRHLRTILVMVIRLMRGYSIYSCKQCKKVCKP